MIFLKSIPVSSYLMHSTCAISSMYSKCCAGTVSLLNSLFTRSIFSSYFRSCCEHIFSEASCDII